MNTILLEPTDFLFFRDGRPMGGASCGQGAAWPLPHVINLAFHAALHRAGFEGVHQHVPGRSSSQRDYSEANRGANGRLFGSLTTAGPFPVCTNGAAPTWFFPRPADAEDSGQPVLLPVNPTGFSSLPAPLRYAVGSTRPPSKESPAAWWSEGTWNAYLGTTPRDPLADRPFHKNDRDFAETEHSYGIGIDPESGSVVEGQFYSANYLRLREGWRLGVFSQAHDKDLNADLVEKLLASPGSSIITGGQQRVCTATRQTLDRLPLPAGATIKDTRVKWVLLTPAIFPEIEAKTTEAGISIQAHPGGWLPSWISHTDGQVMLKAGDTNRGEREGREVWRKRISAMQPISAKLVAAITGKPIPVTGYALPNRADPHRQEGGAKSTHLAVPAGAVYYFECGSAEAAQALAQALNWHGSSPGTEITNRRSTLMGEKGFGLGVCGGWDFHPGNRP